MSNESEKNPARRVEDKRADSAVDWSDAPRFTAMGIAETWAVSVEAEGQRVLCISNDHVSGLDGEPFEQFVPTIRSCAQHLLGFIGASPIASTAGAAKGGITSLEGLTRYEPCPQFARAMNERTSGAYVKFADVERLLSSPAAGEEQTGDLTDEQIDAIGKKYAGLGGIEDYRSFAKDIARAAIAAHLARKPKAERAQAEPVAWMDPSAGCVMDAFLWQKDAANPQYSQPVYAAPVAPAGAQNEEILALHRQLAAEKLRADQGWERAEAKSKECIELRERMAGAQNDALDMQTIRERDYNADMADKLAEGISEHFGQWIGEHSSANCPWTNALDILNMKPELMPCRGTAGAQNAPFRDRDLSKPAEQQGLFHKFDVRRVDGNDQPGGKHYGCRYYVLDLTHDQHAPAAMRAYAASCRTTHPQLAADIKAEFGAQNAEAIRDQATDRELLDFLDRWVAENKVEGWNEFHFAFDHSGTAREQIAEQIEIDRAALQTGSANTQEGAGHG